MSIQDFTGGWDIKRLDLPYLFNFNTKTIQLEVVSNIGNKYIIDLEISHKTFSGTNPNTYKAKNGKLSFTEYMGFYYYNASYNGVKAIKEDVPYNILGITGKTCAKVIHFNKYKVTAKKAEYIILNNFFYVNTPIIHETGKQLEVEYEAFKQSEIDRLKAEYEMMVLNTVDDVTKNAINEIPNLIGNPEALHNWYVDNGFLDVPEVIKFENMKAGHGWNVSSGSYRCSYGTEMVIDYKNKLFYTFSWSSDD